MLRLATLLYTLVGSALAGSAVVFALVAGYDDAQGIIAAAAIGALAAMPVSLGLARKMID